MNVLLLNVSPKSRGSASAFYTSLLRLFLTGCEVQVCQLRRAGDHENVFARDYETTFALLPWADAVVISAPLYVDAAPAHVAAFLEQAQQRCKETPCRFTLYAISNCGFPEGHQNELHLRIYEAWCRCAGVSWGGGLGIGGGVILRWMCMLMPLFAVLDTARLKFLVGRMLQVDSRNLHTFIIGEHGDSEIAAWSSVNVSGIPVNDFCEMRGHYDHEASMEKIFNSVKNSAYEIIARKHATYYGIAMAVCRICAAIVRNEQSILPVSSLMTGEYGLENVVLSIPAVVDENGIETVVPIELNEKELSELQQSATVLKKVIAEFYPD